MWIRTCLTIAALVLLPVWVQADTKTVRLHAPAKLVETGLLKYILPRFSLKTQVKVTQVQEVAQADITFGAQGRPLFEGAGEVWRMDQRSEGHAGTDRFVAWLMSEIGTRTILAYAPEGTPLFTKPSQTEQAVAEITFDGDPVLGLRVSRTHCIRCHVVDDQALLSGIGSTPSFAVLRSLPDWDQRFAAFFALNPHPSFTVIQDVTEPFPHDRPSPIVPIDLTLDDLDAILAYVAGMAPAELGAPLKHQ